MPEVAVKIGGRNFLVSCQEGEESYLHSAAAMLDVEAQAIASQAGRLPESRMLLMSGLLLADKTASAEDQLKQAQSEIAALQSKVHSLESRPDPEPQKIEVPVVPEEVVETLAELSARAEALADRLDEKLAE